MKNLRIIAGLVLINLGVFIHTAVRLPRASNYGWSGPVSRFINSRVEWEMPWLVTLASSLASTGAVVLLRKDKDN